jgi:hypothetical protein
MPYKGHTGMCPFIVTMLIQKEWKSQRWMYREEAFEECPFGVDNTYNEIAL